MVGLSGSDIFASSTVYFLGTWLVPRRTEGQYGPVFMAAGNDATCNLSGFFTQFAVCSPLYNGTLALYYLLMIRFGWKEDRIHKMEWLLHGLPISFAFVTAVTGLALDLYGSVEWLCWIHPSPPQPYFRFFQWAFLFVPLWICVIFVTIVMVILWLTMKHLERAMESYAGGQTSRQNNRSQAIAFQGILYVSAFYVTWFFPSLQRMIELALNRNYFILQMFDTALLPLQGLFNAFIYLRPRIQHYHQTHPGMSWWRVLLNAPNNGRLSVARLRDSDFQERETCEEDTEQVDRSGIGYDSRRTIKTNVSDEEYGDSAGSRDENAEDSSRLNTTGSVQERLSPGAAVRTVNTSDKGMEDEGAKDSPYAVQQMKVMSHIGEPIKQFV